VIVDLSDVTFLDSTALGALAAEARALRERGGALSVVCDDPGTLRVLDMTGLAGFFGVRQTLREAVEAAS
jgi:anti-sigma B factor antagonist